MWLRGAAGSAPASARRGPRYARWPRAGKRVLTAAQRRRPRGESGAYRALGARLHRGGLLLGLAQHALEGGHAGDLPLLPHLVDHLLDVGDVLVDQVGEAALPHEVLAHGDAALLAAVVGVDDLALDHLVQREDAALDPELAQLVAVARVVVPPLGARVERVDERRPTDR